jgi:hypothetical protein
MCLSTPDSITIARWVARILGTGFALFWGAFFVEHLQWFLNHRQLPPLHVFLLQGVHLLLLLGFLIAFKWELPGALLIVISATLFFSFTAGHRAPLFIAVTILPARIYSFCWWQSRKCPLAP